MQAQTTLREHGRNHFRIAQKLRKFARKSAQRSDPLCRIAQPRFRTDLINHPALDDGPCRFPNVKTGIEIARHPFDHHHGFLQQDQLRLQFHVEATRGIKQLLQQLCHGNSIGAAAENGFADGTQRLREQGDRISAWHETRFKMHCGDALVVACKKAGERFGEKAPHRRGEPPHDAEIHTHQASVRIHEQIALMHVGMKKTIA